MIRLRPSSSNCPRRTSVVVAISLSVLLLGLPALAADGDLVWARDTEDEGWDVAGGVAFDSSGNVVVVGQFKGSVDFDPGPGTTTLTEAGELLSGDIAVWKFSPTGNLLWAVRAGDIGTDSAMAVATDGSGNIFVTGSFAGTVDFDPGAGTDEVTRESGGTFVWKLDADGGHEWVRTIAPMTGLDIATDSDGNVITVAYFSGTQGDFDPGAAEVTLTSNGGNDAYVWKLDPDGDLLWVKQAGGTGIDRASAVAVDDANAILVTGYFSSTVDFDPGPATSNLVSNGDRDIFVWKLDSDGALVWARAAGGAGSDSGGAIAVDADQNVLLTGGFVVSVDFDPGAGSALLDGATGRDAFVWKLDSAGGYEWARNAGTTYEVEGSGIAAAADGGVFATGDFRGTADFDPGAGTASLSSNGTGWTDAFVWELDRDGRYLRAARIGGTIGDFGLDAAVSPGGVWAAVGQFYGTNDFDPGPGTVNLTVTGSNDAFVWLLEGSIDTDWDDFADDIDNFPEVYSKCRTSQATIIGNDNANALDGTSGPDVIMGFGGADIINGNGGDDLICAGNGADTITGGDGKDRIYAENGTDTVYGNKKSDRIYGGNGNDTLYGNGGTRDRLFGGDGTDTLNGGTGTDDRCTLGETYANCEIVF
jgi:hypothetical protein